MVNKTALIALLLGTLAAPLAWAQDDFDSEADAAGEAEFADEADADESFDGDAEANDTDASDEMGDAEDSGDEPVADADSDESDEDADEWAGDGADGSEEEESEDASADADELADEFGSDDDESADDVLLDMADSEDSASELMDDQGLVDETGAQATAAGTETSNPESEAPPTIPAPAAPQVVANPAPAPVPAPTPGPVSAPAPAPPVANASPGCSAPVNGGAAGGSGVEKTGTVRSVNYAKGFGFIAETHSQSQIFFNMNSLALRCVRVGDRVRYDVITGPRGQLMATNVTTE